MYLQGPFGPKKERKMEHDHVFGWYHGARRGPPWGGGDFSGGGRPEWFGDWFGGPPPRAERGEVRYLVLDALAQRPRHGYEVIQAIEERSGGAYRPSPGVIYPTLQMLEELAHAELSTQEGRKVYSITDAGRRDLAEHADEVRDFYDRIPGDSWERYAEDFGDVMKRAARLFRTFKRAARHGGMSRKAQAKIREILDQAVQKIEAVLEEDDRR
jgi:DNA-binding PadR family transcriptional regulator